MRRPSLVSLLLLLWAFPASSSPLVDLGIGGIEAYRAVESTRTLTPQQPFEDAYFFSSANGDDENDCSNAAPCRSFARAAELCSGEYVECVFRSGDYWTADDLGEAFGEGHEIIPDCDTQSDLCVLIRASDANVPVFIDCTDSSVRNGVFRSGGDGHGWVGVQGFNVRNCAEDIIDSANDSKLVVAGLTARVAQGRGTHNAFTSHDASLLVVLDSRGVTEGVGMNPTVAAVGASRAILIGDQLLENRSSRQGADVVTASGSARVFIGGHTLRSGAPQVAMDAIEVNATAGQSAFAETFETVATGFPSGGSCYRVVTNGVAEFSELVIRNSSCSGADKAISIDTTGTASFASVKMAGSVIDEVDLRIVDHYGAVSATDLDLENSVFDEDDISAPWRIDAVDYTDQSFLVSTGWTSVFEDADSFDSGGEGVDGNQFSPSPGGGGAANAVDGCAAGNECEAGLQSTAPIHLPFCLPAAVLDERVCGFDLTDHSETNLGAPPRSGAEQNIAPIAEEIPSELIQIGTTPTFSPSITDPDGPGPYGYRWQILQEPMGSSIVADLEAPSLSFPLVQPGVYHFAFVAHDGADATALQDFWISAVPVPEPSFASLLLFGATALALRKPL